MDDVAMVADRRDGVRFGLSSFALKVIACVCMVVDHIGAYLPGMPEELRWVGRLSMPIFLFLIGWGCEFTHDRKRYVLRLYVAGVLMAVLQTVWHDLPNIFLTLFQVALIITLLSVDDWKRRLRNIGLYILWQVGWFAIFTAIDSLFPVVDSNSFLAPFRYLIQAVFGLSIAVDYGLYIVIMGVAFWIARNSRVQLAVIFGVFVVFWMMIVNTQYGLLSMCVIPHALGNICNIRFSPMATVYTIFGFNPMTLGYSLLEYPQWMMIFALPFMLLYNRQYGWGSRGTKWFFYVFYPMHILILYFIGKAMGA